MPSTVPRPRPPIRPATRTRPSRHRHVVRSSLAILLLGAGTAHAQPAPRSDSAAAPAPRYPVLELRRALTVASVGADLLLAAALVPPPVRPLPAQGLDPIGIPLSVDRGSIGRGSSAARTASDYAAYGSGALPLVVAMATAPPGDRWSGLAGTGLVYAQAALITDGLTLLAKRAIGRARPPAYLPTGDRPAPYGAEPAPESTFLSMPSGHASSAWTGAAVTVTEHLLRRPEAGWVERSAVGFLAGALAGGTAALRVHGGVHFPSDVVAGAGLGIASGVAVPLAHRGDDPLPRLERLLGSLGGVAVGAAFGVLVAGAF